MRSHQTRKHQTRGLLHQTRGLYVWVLISMCKQNTRQPIKNHPRRGFLFQNIRARGGIYRMYYFQKYMSLVGAKRERATNNENCLSMRVVFVFLKILQPASEPQDVSRFSLVRFFWRQKKWSLFGSFKEKEYCSVEQIILKLFQKVFFGTKINKNIT